MLSGKSLHLHNSDALCCTTSALPQLLATRQPQLLHIHVKLCLMKPQSPDTWLQTQLILLRREPSVLGVSKESVSLQCFLESKAFREILGLVVFQQRLVMKIKHHINSAH